MSLALRSWRHLKIRRNQLASQKHPMVTLLLVKNHLVDRHLVNRHTETCRTIEQHILTNVNNCLNTTIYSCLETSSGQSSSQYLNVVQFLNTSVNYTFVAPLDNCFPALVSNMWSSFNIDHGTLVLLGIFRAYLETSNLY
jgi:hypothetical protein